MVTPELGPHTTPVPMPLPQTTLDSSLRSRDTIATRPGMMPMLLLRLVPTSSATTPRDTLIGRRCTTVSSGSTLLPAGRHTTSAKPTKYHFPGDGQVKTDGTPTLLLLLMHPTIMMLVNMSHSMLLHREAMPGILTSPWPLAESRSVTKNSTRAILRI